MKKGKPIGVECLTVDPGMVRVVKVVSDEGTADVSHMHPDLVGSAGFQFQGDQRKPVSRLQAGEMGPCGLTGFKVDLS